MRICRTQWRDDDGGLVESLEVDGDGDVAVEFTESATRVAVRKGRGEHPGLRSTRPFGLLPANCSKVG